MVLSVQAFEIDVIGTRALGSVRAVYGVHR